MKYGISISGPIHWAITMGKVPGDIASQIQAALAVFRVVGVLYDSENLHGPVKHAELVVKLGYWLAMGQLTDKEFRIWVDCIPPDDNAGWDVDLLHCPNGSQTRRVLKMGPLASRPESCLVQETVWDSVVS
jgi:hypothetical protein